MLRESMDYDVVIVGGGPAGLSAAIRVKRGANERGLPISVCVIEKGAEIGSHVISGALLDPRALDDLIPQAEARGAPLGVAVSESRFLFLGRRRHLRVPESLLPLGLRNEGLRVLSLGALCRYLAGEAEALGVDILPGFAATEVLFDEAGAVIGVATGDHGRLADGAPGPAFAPSVELRASYTLFAEGARGHLAKQLAKRFDLTNGRHPQTYSLGIKELWEIPAGRHRPGSVLHTLGWPLGKNAHGGGFLYSQADGLVSVGLVTGLDYRQPYLSPFAEFQRLKTHPVYRAVLDGGRRLAYGARAVAAGGLPSLPRLCFPGGALIGDDAGFVNAARGKGIHGAIQSGLLAGEACLEALAEGRRGDELAAYPAAFRKSALFDELNAVRNFKAWMKLGPYLGSLCFGLEQRFFGGRAPWTLPRRTADHEMLRSARQSAPIRYPQPDGVLSFDLASSVYLSGTRHADNQPNHLRLTHAKTPIAINLALYEAPEQRYCPAGVYEILRDEDGVPHLHINAQNCLHCKSCDIKDPMQNIEWTAPEGGDGPNYANL